MFFVATGQPLFYMQYLAEYLTWGRIRNCRFLILTKLVSWHTSSFKYGKYTCRAEKLPALSVPTLSKFWFVR